MNKPKIFKSGNYWYVKYSDGYLRGGEVSWRNALYYAISGWWNK